MGGEGGPKNESNVKTRCCSVVAFASKFWLHGFATVPAGAHGIALVSVGLCCREWVESVAINANRPELVRIGVHRCESL